MSKKPRSHVRILIYQMWAIEPSPTFLVCNHVTRRPCWRSKHYNFFWKNLHKNRVKFPEERNAFVLDHQFGRRDITCKPAIPPSCFWSLITNRYRVFCSKCISHSSRRVYDSRLANHFFCDCHFVINRDISTAYNWSWLIW